ncbi:hypothetical protein DACRYDRAFT_22405 [Dacryopinax primogenitus]|uniref:Uncharacterized protein n=1 Tax=Dacryopinax primogenitus (strain DJM 731) TaxID=1858805 RepID=M5GCW0_DACPD|nr:uncharacterized protein DACRYDRAFT_22405 [Dacryopinax primogenitus]EJU02003.1 hypothetical protein DACRYDRAFT_22405 [Dacryopinax primogenitus]
MNAPRRVVFTGVVVTGQDGSVLCLRLGGGSSGSTTASFFDLFPPGEIPASPIVAGSFD